MSYKSFGLVLAQVTLLNACATVPRPPARSVLTPQGLSGQACSARIDKAYDGFKQARRNASNWSKVFALAQGIGAAVGVVGGTDYGKTHLGGSTSASVGSGISVLSLITAPFVVNVDDANKLLGEYNTLSGEYAHADYIGGTTVVFRNRADSLRIACATGHPEFITARVTTVQGVELH